MTSDRKKSGQPETHFCEVRVKEAAAQPGRGVVKIELGNIYVEVRDADAGAIQEYLLEVLTGSC